jgi:hypothetical protein
MPAKRTDQRHGHRTKAEQGQVDTSRRGSAVVEWPAADEAWHPIAAEWFASLPQSGQVVFFEPSDVALARYVATAMSENLSAGKFSAMLFANVMSAAGELLSSEASRRRLKIELQKDVTEDPEQLQAVASITDRRARMTG